MSRIIDGRRGRRIKNIKLEITKKKQQQNQEGSEENEYEKITVKASNNVSKKV